MRIVLPPSETKSLGGATSPLNFDGLSFSTLGDTRKMLAKALVTLCSDKDKEQACAALGIGPSLIDLIDLNQSLYTSPTMPAVLRYTGVLYDALEVRAMTTTQRARADAQLYVGSALFGLVSAQDSIPHYRLSAGSQLPGLGTLRSIWRPVLSAEFASWQDELVVDLRSGSYQQLGPIPGAVTVQVETEREDGSRAVVSHFNKHYKGSLARLLATSRAQIDDVPSLLRVARRAGLRMERQSKKPQSLTMVVTA